MPSRPRRLNLTTPVDSPGARHSGRMHFVRGRAREGVRISGRKFSLCRNRRFQPVWACKSANENGQISKLEQSREGLARSSTPPPYTLSSMSDHIFAISMFPTSLSETNSISELTEIDFRRLISRVNLTFFSKSPPSLAQL